MKDCILVLYSPKVRPGYEVWSWRHHGQATES
jgi:hypothetical protein